MKSYKLFIFILIASITSSCYDDLGNYDYIVPEQPLVTGIQDSVFVAVVGDTLHIQPGIGEGMADRFSFEWKIIIASEFRDVRFEGAELKTLFSLKPGEYNCLLTVSDSSNGMKYFYDFKILAKTEFTQGTLVLSNDGGQSRLAFIKPDNSVINALYENLNGELLPETPQQLLAVNEAWQMGNVKSYWIICKGQPKPGVIIDANNMFRSQYLNENFFLEPATIDPGYFYTSMNGATSALINEKLYIGTTSTAPISPDYGKYGNYIDGNYQLAPSYIFRENDFYLGYDVSSKAFVWFNSQGSYFGSEYQIDTVGTGFDPNHPGIEFSHLIYISNESIFAYGYDEEGVFSELKFNFKANPAVLTTFYKRAFSRQDLINENNKWIGNPQGIIFFSANDKVYRYNPLNEEVKMLDADFGGKTVSMIEFVPNSDVIVAGTEGALYYLDIGTGKNGNVVEKIEGISGAPVDVFIR